MQMLKVLNDIKHDIGPCHFVACFDMQSGLPLGMVSDKYESQSESIAVAFGNMLELITKGQKQARNDTVRALLNEFIEIFLETTLSTFFVMVPNKQGNIAVAIGVPAGVKLGYVRLCINRHYQNIVESLREIS